MFSARFGTPREYIVLRMHNAFTKKRGKDMKKIIFTIATLALIATATPSFAKAKAPSSVFIGSPTTSSIVYNCPWC
jgi:hypothetical protein